MCVGVCMCESISLAGRKGVGGDGRLIHGTTLQTPRGWAAAVDGCMGQRVCLCGGGRKLQ